MRTWICLSNATTIRLPLRRELFLLTFRCFGRRIVKVSANRRAEDTEQLTQSKGVGWTKREDYRIADRKQERRLNEERKIPNNRQKEKSSTERRKKPAEQSTKSSDVGLQTRTVSRNVESSPIRQQNNRRETQQTWRITIVVDNNCIYCYSVYTVIGNTEHYKI